MQLAAVYKAPGFLLLAVDDDGERLGCVGARALDSDVGARDCEIRRLFVRPQGRGLGLGRALTQRVVSEAIDAGFSRIVLNTIPAMAEAVGLYESMGFELCVPYVEEPQDEVLYFSLGLPGR